MKKTFQYCGFILEITAIYFCCKRFFDAVISNIWIQEGGDSVNQLSKEVLGSLLDIKGMIKYIYPCISYYVFIVLFFGVFVVLVPIAYYKYLDRKQQDLLIYLIGIGLSTLIVVCTLIIGADGEIGEKITRIHLRYFFYCLFRFLFFLWVCIIK